MEIAVVCTVTIEVASEPIRGTLEQRGRERVLFTGWQELAAALEDVRRQSTTGGPVTLDSAGA